MRTRPKRSATGPQRNAQPQPIRKNSKEDSGVITETTSRGGDTGSRQQIAHGRYQYKGVDEGIHAVERPAAPGRPKAANLIRREPSGRQTGLTAEERGVFSR